MYIQKGERKKKLKDKIKLDLLTDKLTEADQKVYRKTGKIEIHSMLFLKRASSNQIFKYVKMRHVVDKGL